MRRSRMLSVITIGIVVLLASGRLADYIMDSFPLKEIVIDEGKEDTGLTMRNHKKPGKKEEMKEQKVNTTSQEGNNEKKGVKFEGHAEREPGMLTEEELEEEAIRDEATATSLTPYPSPEITEKTLAPDTADAATPTTHTVSLTEEDYSELDIFWECVSPPLSSPFGHSPNIISADA